MGCTVLYCTVLYLLAGCDEECVPVGGVLYCTVLYCTYLQGVMKRVSLWGVSWMMTRVSLEMAMNASSWVLLEQSSTTTAQDSAPRSEASGEKRGRTDNFFLGANSAAAGQLYRGEILANKG